MTQRLNHLFFLIFELSWTEGSSGAMKKFHKMVILAFEVISCDHPNTYMWNWTFFKFQSTAPFYGWERNFQNPDFCKFVKTQSEDKYYSFFILWKNTQKPTFYFKSKLHFSKKPTIGKFFIDMTSQFSALSPFGSVFAEHYSCMTCALNPTSTQGSSTVFDPMDSLWNVKIIK